MRENNFFEPYIEKSKFDFKGKNALTAMGILLALLIVLYPVVNQIRIFKINRDVAKIDAVMNSKDNQAKKVRIDKIKETVAEIDEKSKALELVKGDFYKRDTIGDFLVDNITQSMSGDMFLEKIELSEELGTINGVSKTKESIAIFERNLKRIVFFKEVFIPTIKLEEGFYKFDIDLLIDSEAVSITKQKQLDEIKVKKELEPKQDIDNDNDGGDTEIEAE